MEAPQGDVMMEEESAELEVILEQLREKPRSSGELFFKSRRQICTLHHCISASRLQAQGLCLMSHGAASTDDREWPGAPAETGEY